MSFLRHSVQNLEGSCSKLAGKLLACFKGMGKSCERYLLFAEQVLVLQRDLSDGGQEVGGFGHVRGEIANFA